MVDYEDRIIEIFQLQQDAIGATLTAQAREIAALTVPGVLAEIAAARKTEFTVQVMEGITDKIVQNYTKEILKGGTMCVEKVVTPVGGGKVSVTTKQVFVPWLADMTERDSTAILQFFADAEAAGVHPRNQAEMIREYFEGTKHNAVTAARTEAQKLRTDARMASYRESGTKYVQYITAGDELVRPDHAARNGKIYKLKDAPYLGEYNCRCNLTAADFTVLAEGAPVEPSGAVVVDDEGMI